jgi:hypothetical protein
LISDKRELVFTYVSNLLSLKPSVFTKVSNLFSLQPSVLITKRPLKIELFCSTTYTFLPISKHIRREMALLTLLLLGPVMIIAEIQKQYKPK